MLEILI